MSTALSTVKESLSLIADLILPRTCLVCGRTLRKAEQHICIGCASDLPFTYFERQSHNPMADKFNARIEEDSSMGDLPSGRQKQETDRQGCGSSGHEYVYESAAGYSGQGKLNVYGNNTDNSMPSHRTPYAYAVALLYYKAGSGYTKIPQSIKYDYNIRAGRYFGRMLGKRLGEAEWFADIDTIIPVPLHWARKWKRGYNQAEVIAKGIAEALICAGIRAEIRNDVITRCRHTTTQTRLDYESKRKNVAGAFAPASKHASSFRTLILKAVAHFSSRQHNGERQTESQPPVHILLVDDVFTSGSTTLSCYKTLRELYPTAKVSVATLSYVL